MDAPLSHGLTARASYKEQPKAAKESMKLRGSRTLVERHHTAPATGANAPFSWSAEGGAQRTKVVTAEKPFTMVLQEARAKAAVEAPVDISEQIVTPTVGPSAPPPQPEVVQPPAVTSAPVAEAPVAEASAVAAVAEPPIVWDVEEEEGEEGVSPMAHMHNEDAPAAGMRTAPEPVDEKPAPVVAVAAPTLLKWDVPAEKEEATAPLAHLHDESAPAAGMRSAPVTATAVKAPTMLAWDAPADKQTAPPMSHLHVESAPAAGMRTVPVADGEAEDATAAPQLLAWDMPPEKGGVPTTAQLHDDSAPAAGMKSVPTASEVEVRSGRHEVARAPFASYGTPGIPASRRHASRTVDAAIPLAPAGRPSAQPDAEERTLADESNGETWSLPPKPNATVAPPAAPPAPIATPEVHEAARTLLIELLAPAARALHAVCDGVAPSEKVMRKILCNFGLPSQHVGLVSGPLCAAAANGTALGDALIGLASLTTEKAEQVDARDLIRGSAKSDESRMRALMMDHLTSSAAAAIDDAADAILDAPFAPPEAYAYANHIYEYGAASILPQPSVGAIAPKAAPAPPSQMPATIAEEEEVRPPPRRSRVSEADATASENQPPQRQRRPSAAKGGKPKKAPLSWTTDGVSEGVEVAIEEEKAKAAAAAAKPSKPKKQAVVWVV